MRSIPGAMGAVNPGSMGEVDRRATIPHVLESGQPELG